MLPSLYRRPAPGKRRQSCSRSCASGRPPGRGRRPDGPRRSAAPRRAPARAWSRGNAVYRNTLGVAYYRAGRYREAVTTLRPNLEGQGDAGLASDLYFLAMSHHRLGEAERARDYYDWAVRWARAQRGLSAGRLEELAMFRAEAAELLGVKEKKE